MLNSKVIICAGGDGGVNAPNSRWKEKEFSRHMVPIKGIPLIHYIQKQMKDKGFTDIHVACDSHNRSKYVLSGIKHIPSPRCFGKFYEHCTVYHYRQFLNKGGTTVMLYGDTYYTDEFIDAVSKDDGQMFHVYGRHNASDSITKNDRNNEKFAYVMHRKDLGRYIKLCETLMPTMEHELQYNYWVQPTCFPQLVYREFSGIRYNDNRVENKHWIEWNDLTDDFDLGDDWKIKSELFPHIFRK